MQMNKAVLAFLSGLLLTAQSVMAQPLCQIENNGLEYRCFISEYITESDGRSLKSRTFGFVKAVWAYADLTVGVEEVQGLATAEQFIFPRQHAFFVLETNGDDINIEVTFSPILETNVEGGGSRVVGAEIHATDIDSDLPGFVEDVLLSIINSDEKIERELVKAGNQLLDII